MLRVVIDLKLGTELGDYRLDDLIGHGGMGAVFRATQLTLHRTVAIKIILPDRGLDEELRVRFIREARVAAAIEHPNIIPIYDVGAVDGLLFIAMRFVAGPSLSDELAKEAPLEPARAVAILDQVARALQAAHDLGVVHRDVKPNNILLTDHGGGEHAYLADFGLARFIAQTGLTQTGQTMGTMPYMSPEQILGQKVDHRTDIYALGCVLFEMLTGSVPFPRDDSAAIIHAHLSVDPVDPSALRPELFGFDGIVPRALAKDPDSRYATTLEFAAEAARALGSTTPTSGPPPVTGEARWPSRITQSFIRSYVPAMDESELDAFVSELRRRNWTEEELLERVYPFVGGARPGAESSNDTPAALLLYASVGAGSRTRELLRVLPGGREYGLTPTELGVVMRPDDKGQPLSKASVRAVIRNLLRVENRLILEERISRRVLSVDFARYDVDGAGRYYVDGLDREALDEHLAADAPSVPVASPVGSSEPRVLVWQRNPAPAVYHRDEECPSLRSKEKPDRSVVFGGPGTAGWLALAEARKVPGARPCQRCM